MIDTLHSIGEIFAILAALGYAMRKIKIWTSKNHQQFLRYAILNLIHKKELSSVQVQQLYEFYDEYKKLKGNAYIREAMEDWRKRREREGWKK